MRHGIMRLALSFGLLLSGCAAPPAPMVSDALFHDAWFKPPTEAVDAGDLFTLSPAMQAYLDSPNFRRQVRSGGPVQGMIDALYTKGELKLDYDDSETRPAATTFAARKGNCLSLVIMTAAFAKALDLDVFYRDVAVEEQWSRNGGLYVASTHVNLSLAKKRNLFASEDDPDERTVIDFIPITDATRQRAAQIVERTIVAMYMNNRAAEALGKGQYDNAYWWAQGALRQDATFMSAYNTLGVAYHKHGNYGQAEYVYKRALERAPDDTTLMGNLVHALKAGGKSAESAAVAARLAALQPAPPYHYFEKGMQALQAGDLPRARDLFAREVRRAPYNHEFHYWLAVTHLRLGNASAARSELSTAIGHSTTAATAQYYTDKLNYLRSLTASTSPVSR